MLAAALLLAAAPAGAGRTDWRQLTVGHFHLYSTLGDSATRDIARQLQAFEQTVGELLQSQDRLPDVPTLIYVLNHADFNRYVSDRPGLGGLFAERPHANVIAIDGSQRFDGVKVTVFHEYVHFIQRNAYSMRLPPWYVEGYAELFSSFKIDGQKIVLGNLPAGVGVDMTRWIPVERLLAVKQSDPEYRAERLMPQFYGEAWALVHLLLFDDTTLARPTNLYLDNLDVGLPEPEAFTHAFAFDKAGLDQMLRAFIAQRKIHIKVLTLPQSVAVAEAPVLRLTEAQADAELARLAFRLGKPEDVTAPLIAAALGENPADAATRALAARTGAHFATPVDIADLADALAKGGAGDPQLRIDVADTLVTRLTTRAAAAQAVAILDDLVHADAPPLEAVAVWSEAAAVVDLDPARLVAVLEPAAARAPHDTRLLQALAGAYESTGAKAKARSCYARIMVVSKNTEQRIWAQQQADSERLADGPPSKAR